MPKNIVQDIIPRGGRRSIRDVPLPRESKVVKEITSSKKEEGVVFKIVEDSYHVETEENIESYTGFVPKNFSKIVLWSISVVSVIVVVAILGGIFSSAILTVTPQSQKVAINLNLTAKPKASLGEISYTSVNLVRDKEEIVPADGERPVESRSSGRIIIYNNYSASSQRLVKNTRFETPDGLIYKISDSVTVPGRSSTDGKIIPGSIEALVYAETVGEEYNIGLTDFTLPGLKSNTERFNSFYGRSKTSMTGGKIGTEKMVSDEKMIQARARLEGSLTQELLAEAVKLVPEESIFYDTAYRIEFEPVLSGAITKGNNVAIRERAYFTAFFIKRDELVKTITENALEDVTLTDVDVANVDTLKMEIKSKGKFSATSVGPIKFSLQGEAFLVWNFDETKLKNDLKTQKRGELSTVISEYPAIVKADVTIRPFWKTAFPKNPSKIKILSVPNVD